MAVLMEEDLERNLDNLLRVPHSAGDYVLREGWSSTLKIVNRIQIDFQANTGF